MFCPTVRFQVQAKVNYQHFGTAVQMFKKNFLESEVHMMYNLIEIFEIGAKDQFVGLYPTDAGSQLLLAGCSPIFDLII